MPKLLRISNTHILSISRHAFDDYFLVYEKRYKKKCLLLFSKNKKSKQLYYENNWRIIVKTDGKSLRNHQRVYGEMLVGIGQSN